MLPDDSITTLLLITALSLTLTHAKNFEYRLIQSNNIQRLELLQQKCDKYDLDNNEPYQNTSIHTLSDADLEHLLIDRKHKLLYCYVPKVSFSLFALVSLMEVVSTQSISFHTSPRVVVSCTTDRIISDCPGNVRWKFFDSKLNPRFECSAREGSWSYQNCLLWAFLLGEAFVTSSILSIHCYASDGQALLSNYSFNNPAIILTNIFSFSLPFQFVLHAA